MHIQDRIRYAFTYQLIRFKYIESRITVVSSDDYKRLLLQKWNMEPDRKNVALQKNVT